MADVPAVKISADPEAPVDDALDQAMDAGLPLVPPAPSIDIEVPEADALEQAIPVYFDDEGDERR